MENENITIDTIWYDLKLFYMRKGLPRNELREKIFLVIRKYDCVFNSATERRKLEILKQISTTRGKWAPYKNLIFDDKNIENHIIEKIICTKTYSYMKGLHAKDFCKNQNFYTTRCR